MNERLEVRVHLIGSEVEVVEESCTDQCWKDHFVGEQV